MPEKIDMKWLMDTLEDRKRMMTSMGNATLAIQARLSLGKIIEDDINKFVATLPEAKRSAAASLLNPKANDPFTHYDNLIKRTLNHDSAVVEKQILALF